MNGFFLGLDGGGTKTEAALTGPDGAPLRSFRAGAINYNSVSPETLSGSIAAIFRQAAEYAGGLEKLRAVGIGAAGISNPDASKAITAAVRESGYRGPLIIRGDQEAAFYGALLKNRGIILIAGTGSICFGKNAQGESRRTGGCGHIIDDEGSGYDIGRQILSLTVKILDGRAKPSKLAEKTVQKLGVSNRQGIVRFVYGGAGKKEIASLAPLLTDACQEGDAAALALKDRMAASLAALVPPVAEGLGLQAEETALAGSILQKDPFIREATVKILRNRYPDMAFIPPRGSAALGAALFAAEALASGQEI